MMSLSKNSKPSGFCVIDISSVFVLGDRAPRWSPWVTGAPPSASLRSGIEESPEGTPRAVPRAAGFCLLLCERFPVYGHWRLLCRHRCPLLA